MAKINGKLSKDIKVKGLTTESILNMDVYKLNTRSLRKVTSRLISTANKRIRRLRQKAPNSRALIMHPNEFSLKGIKKNDRNSIESTMKQIRKFLKAESSTMTGYNRQRAQIEQDIGEFESIEQEKEFWNVFNSWVDKNENLAFRFNDSTQLRSLIFNRFVTRKMSDRGTKISITRAIKKMLDEQNGIDAEKDREMRDVLKNDDSLQLNEDF